MDIFISSLKDVEILKSKEGIAVTIRLTEKDGNYYGSKSDIRMSAEDYKKVQEVIVEDFLENETNV